MSKIEPVAVFGFHEPDDWMSRYCRFRAKLPAGSHKLAGKVYNPEGEDLAGNEVMVLMNRSFVGEIFPSETPQWSPFLLDLPELSTEQYVDIVLRTSRFRCPPPPDERIVGIILGDLRVETQEDRSARTASE